MEILVGKALLSSLEFSAIFFDAVNVERMQLLYTFQNIASSLNQLKSLLLRNLFEWFQVQGFTHSYSTLSPVWMEGVRGKLKESIIELPEMRLISGQLYSPSIQTGH